MIILAAAMGLKNELGKEDGVPLWDLPDEYERFRKSIRSHPVIMGRKSFDVIQSPLEGSLNIVVTRNENYDGNGALVAHSLEEAIEQAGDVPVIYVIGGGRLFDSAIRVADRMELSMIEETFPEATAFFPTFSTEEWVLISSARHEKDERHACAFTYEVWLRKEHPEKVSS